MEERESIQFCRLSVTSWATVIACLQMILSAIAIIVFSFTNVAVSNMHRPDVSSQDIQHLMNYETDVLFLRGIFFNCNCGFAAGFMLYYGVRMGDRHSVKNFLCLFGWILYVLLTWFLNGFLIWIYTFDKLATYFFFLYFSLYLIPTYIVVMLIVKRCQKRIILLRQRQAEMKDEAIELPVPKDYPKDANSNRNPDANSNPNSSTASTSELDPMSIVASTPLSKWKSKSKPVLLSIRKKTPNVTSTSSVIVSNPASNSILTLNENPVSVSNMHSIAIPEVNSKGKSKLNLRKKTKPKPIPFSIKMTTQNPTANAILIPAPNSNLTSKTVLNHHTHLSGSSSNPSLLSNPQSSLSNTNQNKLHSLSNPNLISKSNPNSNSHLILTSDSNSTTIPSTDPILREPPGQEKDFLPLSSTVDNDSTVLFQV